MHPMLQNSVVYDVESYGNVFTFAMEMLYTPQKAIWEISPYRNDSQALMQFLQHMAQSQMFAIGYNNLGYDYVLLHWLMNNPQADCYQIKQKSNEIIESKDRFAHNIWASDRYIPQIDLQKTHHLELRQSLKGLEINMRSRNVVESSIAFDQNLTEEQVNRVVVPYNQHDVSETKQFALHSIGALEFRIGLIPEHGVDVVNWSDAKIGEKIVIKRLGDDICYDKSSGKKRMRQTPRTEIAFNDIIFPYIQFENPEFQRVLDFLRSKTLRADELDISEDGTPSLKTKGVFKGLTAIVGGVEFGFGVGGIHGSVNRKKIISTEDYRIIDIDVKGQYPNVAISNNLSPAHLGQPFVVVYTQIPEERDYWKDLKGGKCYEANSMKLAANAVYGKSNSKFSPFFDPQFTMTITVNGQLMLAMIIEKLVKVPTLQIIQANTDGISFYVHKDHEEATKTICREWEAMTGLIMEDDYYNRMFVRDVNGYIAEDMNGNLKLKGPYWTPDPQDWCGSIASSQPPAWHKNLSNPVSPRAAIAHMAYGVDIEQFIRMCTNPFDFTVQVKINRSDKLLRGDKEEQRNSRFYISTNGERLVKKMPALGPIGEYKKSPKVSATEYEAVMIETGGAWDERVCTKNKGQYDVRETSIASGYLVHMANNIDDFDFNNINYDWYVNEARKLVV